MFWKATCCCHTMSIWFDQHSLVMTFLHQVLSSMFRRAFSAVRRSSFSLSSASYENGLSTSAFAFSLQSTDTPSLFCGFFLIPITSFLIFYLKQYSIMAPRKYHSRLLPQCGNNLRKHLVKLQATIKRTFVISLTIAICQFFWQFLDNLKPIFRTFLSAKFFFRNSVS